MHFISPDKNDTEHICRLECMNVMDVLMETIKALSLGFAYLACQVRRCVCVCPCGLCNIYAA